MNSELQKEKKKITAKLGFKMHNAGTEKDGLGELQQSGWMLTTSFNYKKQ